MYNALETAEPRGGACAREALTNGVTKAAFTCTMLLNAMTQRVAISTPRKRLPKNQLWLSKLSFAAGVLNHSGIHAVYNVLSNLPNQSSKPLFLQDPTYRAATAARLEQPLCTSPALTVEGKGRSR
eukprot:6179321-Pleurochrysis_carterae.AAC.1